ncbi:MAG: tetratricopeptide repeat protein [Promethearchaeota archaeon]
MVVEPALDEGIKLFQEGACNDALQTFERVLSDPGVNSQQAKEALKYVGLIFNNLKDFDGAASFYQKLLDSASLEGKPFILNRLGMLHQARKEFDKAIEYNDHCLAMCREASNKKWEAVTLRNLGRLYTIKGEHVKALKCHEESLRIKREIGDREGEATSLVYWANDYEDSGDFQKALDLLKTARAIYEELSVPEKVEEIGDEIARLEDLEASYIEEETLLVESLRASRRVSAEDFFDKFL